MPVNRPRKLLLFLSLFLVLFTSARADQLDDLIRQQIEKRKIPVYVVAEDLDDRGIARGELVPGVQLLSRSALPGLFADYALVNHW